jgi:hypothetical protein
VSDYILWLRYTLFSSVQLFWIYADAVILKITPNYEECRLLGCGAVWVYYEPTFRRNVSPPSSGYKNWRRRWLTDLLQFRGTESTGEGWVGCGNVSQCLTFPQPWKPQILDTNKLHRHYRIYSAHLINLIECSVHKVLLFPHNFQRQVNIYKGRFCTANKTFLSSMMIVFVLSPSPTLPHRPPELTLTQQYYLHTLYCVLLTRQ